MKIGWGKRDISTNKPIAIPGQFHLRVSQGVIDPIMVTSLTLKGDDDYVIFLSCDLVTVLSGVLNEVKEKVNKICPEINTDKILMNVSHTHSGPLLEEGENMGNWGPLSGIPHDDIEITSPGEYRSFFTDMAAEAVCESFMSAEEGMISYGYGYAVVAHSRRVVYSEDMSKLSGSGDSGALFVDGRARMYGNTKDDKFSHYEAGADHFANFLFTFDKNEKLTGAIVNIPCPSQLAEEERHLSADFWHDIRKELSEKYGDIYVLPQCAAGGDLAPRVLHYKDAQSRRFKLKYFNCEIDERVENKEKMLMRFDIAERVCQSFDEVLSWASREKFDTLPIMHTVKTIWLDKRLVSEEEYQHARKQLENQAEIKFETDGTPIEKLDKNSMLLAANARYKGVVERYEKQQIEPKYPMELHVIRVGDIAFASNSFELYMDFQHRIQARSPFIQTFVVQLCALPDRRCGSYLATERGAESKGYSASLFCNLVSPEGGQQLVDETVAELNKLFSVN